MAFISVLIDPRGEEWYDAYGPITKKREEATRFASMEAASAAANIRFGRCRRTFWSSELDAKRVAEERYRGWTCRMEKNALGN